VRETVLAEWYGSRKRSLRTLAGLNLSRRNCFPTYGLRVMRGAGPVVSP
jgi:hypothetical protein